MVWQIMVEDNFTGIVAASYDSYSADITRGLNSRSHVVTSHENMHLSFLKIGRALGSQLKLPLYVE